MYKEISISQMHPTTEEKGERQESQSTNMQQCVQYIKKKESLTIPAILNP